MEDQPQLNRAERKRKLTKDKIMRSGRVLFKDKGYHATAVADIMEHADLGHGTFYQYFQNKPHQGNRNALFPYCMYKMAVV